MTEVFWQGAKEFQRAIDAQIAAQAAAAREGLVLSAHKVEDEIKTQLSMSGGGSSQGRDSKGRFTGKGGGASSAPGSPPALQTGTLRRSVYVDGPRQVGTNSWEAQVGPTVVYGRIQELGGDTGRGHATHLPPRPYVQPGLEAAKDFMIETFKRVWSVWGGR